MTLNQEILNALRTQAQKLVSDIAQRKEYEVLHTGALELLLKIVELQGLLAKPIPSPRKQEGRDMTMDTSVSEEINKVARKLPKWAKNQHQINSKILTLFLQLKRDGIETITEDLLTDRYGDISEFYRNYPQMKSISPKNHAKVFESRSGIVEIWELARSYVQEYEKTVFGNN